MNETVLKIEKLSKQYRLGVLGTGTLSHDLNRWWHLVRGKEDPYLKIGENNDRTSKGSSDYIWALKDINFEVEKGEVLGILGKNGAGKSTLLKILSKVTSPSEGKITSVGRIASLLEVGTGFHPELTGKENIYLNGAILGMTKEEINNKLDEIIEFSGCDRYIDTPVKRYSSGMKVRLAFAVAAHLESEILIVDEVLAVGDNEFQKKAIGKMKDISGNHERTVLFVSHNLEAVKTLCTRCLLLNNGEVQTSGSTTDVINEYLKNENKLICYHKTWELDKAPGNLNAKILGYQISTNNSKDEIILGDTINIAITYKILKTSNLRIDLSIHIYNSDNILVCNVNTKNEANMPDANGDIQTVTFHLNEFAANSGNYYCTLRIIENQANSAILRVDEMIHFKIDPPKNNIYLPKEGILYPKFEIIK